MKYSIPLNKLEKLEKIIRRYQKKGANIIFNVGDEVIEDATLTVEDTINHCLKSFPIKVTCKEVFVDGVYVINDWEFVGTIEFTELGNIIRVVDSSFEGMIPEKYLHTPKICEHCGKIRNRKDTYLIFNTMTAEFKQVGSTCLLDYTKGLDANECASIMACLDKVSTLADKDCFADEFFGNGYDSTSYGYSREVILPLVYAYVSKYGYERMNDGKGTAQDVKICVLKDWNLLGEEMSKFYENRYNSLVMPSDEEMNAIDEFAKAHLEDNFGYMRNASIAWLKKSVEYRDFGLVASFVATYKKEMKKQELQNAKIADSSNEWVGNVGDRITIKVASIRCLWSNCVEVAWHTYAETFFYEIKDEEGHTFTWKSSKNLEVRYEENTVMRGSCPIEETKVLEVKPLEIVATVKEHSSFRGLKQTVLTRGKVTKSEEIK